MITMKDIASKLRSFDTHNVTFWDFESITENGDMWNLLIDTMTNRYKKQAIDFIVCLDARGFLLGGAIACALGGKVGIKLIRKAGKLPGPVHSVEYGLEYRDKDVVEIQDSQVMKGKRVLVVDDVLATGGTAAAAVELVERVGGIVAGLAFAIEIPFLEGRSKLLNYMVTSEISIINDVPYAEVEYCVDMMTIDSRDKELILIERLNYPEGIAMPGGRIEDESPITAAKRELMEETGCKADLLHYLGILSRPDRDPRGVKVSIVMGCISDSSNARGEPGKTKIVRVPSLQNLPPDEKILFGHRDFICMTYPNLVPSHVPSIN